MKTANIGIILVVLLIGLCGCLGFGEKRACRKACTAIEPLETNLEITKADLEKGMYFGNLIQKRQGTPNNWIHASEGQHNSAWLSKEKSKGRRCDCTNTYGDNKQ